MKKRIKEEIKKKKSNKTAWIIAVIAIIIVASVSIFAYYRYQTTSGEICAEYGEHFSAVYKEEYPETCCEGLAAWDSGFDTSISIGNKCYETGAMAGSPVGTCINCGDGICDELETVCNCPQDCSNSSHSTYKNVQDFCVAAYNTFCAEESNHDSILCKLCSLV